jgi:ABC-type branched-subunit amino acid transport system permease subunit
MCFALFVASLSFTGQLPKRFIPKQYHVPALFALPVLAVLVTMFYWLWRVRRRRPIGRVAERLREAPERATPANLAADRRR